MKKNRLKVGAFLSCISVMLPLKADEADLFEFNAYGRLNMTYQLEDNKQTGKVWKLASNASRIGLKGNSIAKSNMSLIYQIELSIEADDGDKDGETLTQRDSFIGVQSDWGRVKAGILTIPFKEAKGNFDHFNDLQGELGKIVDGEKRLSNVLQYDTHKLFGPITATVAIVPGEDTSDNNKDGPADGISSAIEYKQKNLFLSASLNSNIEDLDQYRLVATWPISALRLGLMYQHTKTHTKETQLADGRQSANAYGVSTSYKFGLNTINAQYIVSESSSRLSDANQLAVGWLHQLNASATFFTYFTDRNAEQADKTERYYAVGLKYNF